MDNSLVEFREKLKKLKVKLKDLSKKIFNELNLMGDLSKDLSVNLAGLKMDGGTWIANGSEIEKRLPLTQKCIKYLKELDKISMLMIAGGYTFSEPPVTMAMYRRQKNKTLLFESKGEELIDKLMDNSFVSKTDNIASFINGIINGNIGDALKLIRVYVNVYYFAEIILVWLKNISEIINAIDNYKIKGPVNDIGLLYVYLIMVGMEDDELSNILGKVAMFNSKYAQKNKNHNIENIALCDKLAKCCNNDGIFDNRILSCDEFKRVLDELRDYGVKSICLINLLGNIINGIIQEDVINIDKDKLNVVSERVLELFRNRSWVNSQANDINDKIKRDDSKFDRNFIEYLQNYYKNGMIIGIPDDLDDFYHNLDESVLDEKEKSFIRKLMEDKIVSIRNQNRFKYLAGNELLVYECATKLLDSLNNTNSDYWELKQLLDDLHAYFEFLDGDLSDDDRAESLKEISNIIGNVSLICDKYDNRNVLSTNRYIFLLNKDGNPYICDDLSSLDRGQRSPITSLIGRISPDSVSKFNVVHSNLKMQYRMQEYLTGNGHVAFVEVDAGIYVIIGANVPRQGYDVFNNRLRANQEIVKQIEAVVKNPNTRNKILAEHEEYYRIVTEGKGSPANGRLVRSKKC